MFHCELNELTEPIFIASVCSAVARELEDANVLCLPALLTFGYSEFNSLSFFQAAVSAALDGGKMHEDIFSALA